MLLKTTPPDLGKIVGRNTNGDKFLVYGDTA